MPSENLMAKIRLNLKSDEQRMLFDSEMNELKKYA
jgi:hypothetical protein